ncbi:DUF6470 family protein [Alkaliphilus crotonatoxidans]
MQIQIRSQNALIGIGSTHGQYSIRQHQWLMELRAVEPELKIKMSDAILLIDQSQCFAEAGLKGIQQINRDYAAKGHRDALRGIARIAREGKELADIHKGPAIAKQAKRRYHSRRQEFQYTMIPKSRPKITVIPQEVTGQYQKGYVEVKTGKIKPDIDYYPGKLDIYLRQKNSVEIQFVGKNVDVYGG